MSLSALAASFRPAMTLVALWHRNRAECRGLGSIMDDAREGRLPGVVPSARGHGFEVVGEGAALAAMRRA